MSKFLEKVLKMMMKLKHFRFMEKFMNFLMEVFAGKNGDILDNISKVVNLTVDTVELFEDTVKEKLDSDPLSIPSSNEILTEIQDEVPGCLLSNEDINLLDDLISIRLLAVDSFSTIGVIVDEKQALKDQLALKLKKGEIKFALARNAVLRNLEENKVEYTVQLIGLAIQAAVIKMKK